MGIIKDLYLYSIRNTLKDNVYLSFDNSNNTTVSEDIFSINHCYLENSVKRLPNLERIEIKPIENSQTVLYKIEELRRKLNSKIPRSQKELIKQELEPLYEKYEKFLDAERYLGFENKDYKFTR